MPIAGIQFDKILAEKLKPLEPPLKINSSMAILDVSKEDATSKGNAYLKFVFEFKLDYSPKQADVVLKGHVLYMDTEKEVDKVLSGWKKTKKIEPELMRQVLNVALMRANIKALLITQEVGLPPHIQIPTIGNKPKAYHG